MAIHHKLNGTVNPDLLKERKTCTFNILELTHLLDGGEEMTNERKEREKFLLEDPELKSEIPIEYLSHKEKYEESVRIACKIFQKVARFDGGQEIYKDILGGYLGQALLKEGNPLTLHYGMFIQTLTNQADYQSQAEWIWKAWNCDIIGTYAQTELGHGTFIRGMETTATYDQKTEEFILNSPSLTAYKWWPGGLGQVVNHAVVFAQLYTHGRCHGIHSFIVPLRDDETHVPLPGIKIGEVGCRMGLNCLNNGYLGFENVRIPRNNMLMKHSKVLPDGTYVKSSHSKLVYGTMTYIRALMVHDAATYLKKAVVIGTRYSAVRRQSHINLNESEVQILDFLTQQEKLFPYISMCIAFHFAAKHMWDIYVNTNNELDSGHLDNFTELHATTCVLKAVSSADATEGAETLRLACGGHGYMMSSNLPGIYATLTAMCTYEGENTVLLLQAARFLIKTWQNKSEIKESPTLKYLETSSYKNTFEKSVQWIISSLQQTLSGKLDLVSRHIEQRISNGQSYEEAWNNTSIELAETAKLYGRIVIVSTYADMTNKHQKDTSSQLGIVLQQLLELHAVHTILRTTGDVLRFTSALGKDFHELQSWFEELLAGIRPNAIGIVDGFDICDEVLSSTLGAYDGNVYQRIFEEAQKSPLNAEPVNKSFHMYLKPYVKSNL